MTIRNYNGAHNTGVTFIARSNRDKTILALLNRALDDARVHSDIEPGHTVLEKSKTRYELTVALSSK